MRSPFTKHWAKVGKLSEGAMKFRTEELSLATAPGIETRHVAVPLGPIPNNGPVQLREAAKSRRRRHSMLFWAGRAVGAVVAIFYAFSNSTLEDTLVKLGLFAAFFSMSTALWFAAHAQYRGMQQRRQDNHENGRKPGGKNPMWIFAHTWEGICH
jgi:hypothetical protein